jgi:twinkle protein
MSALDKIVEMFPNRIGDIDLDPFRCEDYTPRVKSAPEYLDALKKRINQREAYGAMSGFACDRHFRFRPYELTIWTGYKGHGKSALLSQSILGFMQHGQKVFVCSPEFPPVELLFRFLVQIIACDNPSEEEAEVLIEFAAKTLWLYDVQSSLKPHDVPALCRWVMENIKPDHIVVDSLMKCGLAPDDYSGQKRLVDQLQTVAHQYPVHIHLVAHARKGNSDDKPARLHDIKGASEIADLAENVVSVWRNKPKEQARSQGDATREMEPDALFIVEAQRNCGGWVGTVNLNYRPDAMIFFETGRDFRSYVSIAANEVAL